MTYVPRARGLGVQSGMVDFDTLIASLGRYGYSVERVIEVPANAGEAELVVNGQVLTLAEVRQLLVDAEEKEAGTQP